jgi:hypothetical protein
MLSNSSLFYDAARFGMITALDVSGITTKNAVSGLSE